MAASSNGWKAISQRSNRQTRKASWISSPPDLKESPLSGRFLRSSTIASPLNSPKIVTQPLPNPATTPPPASSSPALSRSISCNFNPVLVRPKKPPPMAPGTLRSAPSADTLFSASSAASAQAPPRRKPPKVPSVSSRPSLPSSSLRTRFFPSEWFDAFPPKPGFPAPVRPPLFSDTDPNSSALSSSTESAKTSSQPSSPRSSLGDSWSEPGGASSGDSSSENPTIDTAEKRSTTLMKAIAGLIQGERKYIEEVNILKTVFYDPLQKSGVLDRKSQMEIFSTIEFIHGIHSDFLRELESVTKDVLFKRLGKVFLEHLVRFFRVYYLYCDRYQHSFSAISRAKRNPAFKGFLKNCNKESKEMLGDTKMFDYLNKPLHRVLAYSLFFKEILKVLPRNKDGNLEGALKEAMEQMEQLADYIRKSDVLSSNLQDVLDVYFRVSGFPDDFELVSTKRTLIREGSLIKVNPRKEEQERTFFLFSDLLIYGKKNRLNDKKYTMKGMLPIDVMLIRDRPDTKDRVNAFQIVRMDHKKKIYTILAKSPREKQEWVQDLERIVNESLARHQKQQKIPQDLAEVIDVTISFLLWGVIPSSRNQSQSNPSSGLVSPMKGGMARLGNATHATLRRNRLHSFIPLPNFGETGGSEDSGVMELNSAYPWPERTSTPQEAANTRKEMSIGDHGGNAVKLSILLLAEILAIYWEYSFLFERFGERATRCILLDARYERFVMATGELKDIATSPSDTSLTLTTNEEKMAFFLNVYHLLHLHAHVEFDIPRGSPARHHQFLQTAAYNIGGISLSLIDLEHRILRAPMSLPTGDIFGSGVKLSKTKPGKKKENKVLERFAVDRAEPLLNFAMASLTKGSADIRLYDVEKLFVDLKEAAEAYLSKHIVLETRDNRIGLPKVMEWYSKDFLGNAGNGKKGELVSWCVKYLKPEQKEQVYGIMARLKSAGGALEENNIGFNSSEGEMEVQAVLNSHTNPQFLRTARYSGVGKK